MGLRDKYGVGLESAGAFMLCALAEVSEIYIHVKGAAAAGWSM
jgi:hypothetical protein